MLSLIQLFSTPWTAHPQAPLSMGSSWQEYWSGLPFPPLGDLPNAGIEPVSFNCRTLHGVSRTAGHQGSLKEICGKPKIVFFLKGLPTLKSGFPFLHYLTLLPFLSHLLCCLPFSWVFSPSTHKNSFQTYHFLLYLHLCLLNSYGTIWF